LPWCYLLFCKSTGALPDCYFYVKINCMYW
jgi:hypothetical protein